MPEADGVLRQRLSTQRLTAAPSPSVADTVALLTCVQAQDPALSRFSLGLRTTADDAGVRAAIDEGSIVRTHILRPTWHYVGAADLRWILAATSAKVESAMAARHRQLGVDDPTLVDRAHEVIASALSGRTFLARPQIASVLADHGLPNSGEQVGHLLLLAELRALVCSGPLRGNTHQYALVDEWVRPSPPLDRVDAVRELTRRFFAGHGPASVADLVRWTTLTQGDVKAALADLGGELTAVEVDGTPLWFDPMTTADERSDAPRAFLFPVFDEAYLSYARLNFPRLGAHPRGDQPHSFGEAGGGVVVVDRGDAGWWKRTNAGADRVVVRRSLAGELSREQRGAVDEAAERLAAFSGRRLEVVSA